MKVQKPIIVLDNNKTISITHDDILKYHGYEMVGGVALAYRLLLWALPQISADPLERGFFSFYSGIGENGKGIIDTAEMVLRVKTHNTLNLDKEYSMDKEAPLAPNGGRYYFELGHKDKKLCIALKDGLVLSDFISCSKKAYSYKQRGEQMPEDELQQLMLVRQGLAKDILNAEADDLFILLGSTF